MIDTPRLRLRRLTLDDAGFIVELLNDPDWLRFIGDRNVRTPEDARAWLERAPLAMYARLGYGMYLVEVKAGGGSAGICGLVKRDGLADVDIGFAFLPAFRGRGYAFEAAQAALEQARASHGISRVVAISVRENGDSIRLLERLGFRFEATTRLAAGAEELLLYAQGPTA